MNSDQLVSARDVLRAIEEVRRIGIDRLLVDWERREPDLSEHLLEGVSDLHRRIAAIAPHPKAERQLMRRTETLILVLLTAFRRAMLRQWEPEDSTGGDPPVSGSDAGQKENEQHGGDGDDP